MKVKRNQVQLKKLSDEDDGYVEATPEERFAMVWELTAEAYSLFGSEYVEKRMPRHIAKLIRR